MQSNFADKVISRSRATERLMNIENRERVDMTDPPGINAPSRKQRPVNGAGSHLLAGLIRRRCIGRPFMAAGFVTKIPLFSEYPIYFKIHKSLLRATQL